MAFHNKSFFIERTDSSLRVVRVGAGPDGDVVEEMREASPHSVEEARAFIGEFSEHSVGGLLRAHCAVYPTGRVIRDCSLKSETETGGTISLQEAITSQLRIDPNQYALTALHADDGLVHEPASRAQRELVICGAPQEELRREQDYLVAAGVFPLRIELGSVAGAGMLLKALRAQKIQDPLLVLELGEERSHVIILSGNRVESAKPLPLGLNSMVAAVREELGLKDEAAARKLFYSDSFDFREMGPRLIHRLFRELQSMTGFYEVQTGQSIARVLCNLLPPKLTWLDQTFASSLGMARFQIDLPLLLGESGLSLAESNPPVSLYPPLGLLGLMVNQEVTA